jgi:hypothetical protein
MRAEVGVANLERGLRDARLRSNPGEGNRATFQESPGRAIHLRSHAIAGESPADGSSRQGAVAFARV